MVGFDHSKKRLSPWDYSIAGGFAGAATRFCAQPFDVVKIRFQLQVEPIDKFYKSSKYVNMYQAFRLILLEEGISGLWKGHLSGQLLSIIYGIAQFQTFELTTKFAEEHFHTKSRSTKIHAVCGSIAGGIATIVSFPFDVLRTRFIAQGNKKVYFSLIQGFKTMLKEEGPQALYRGMTPSMLLVVPQAGAIFASHNFLTSVFKKMRSDADLGVIENLIVGSLAGTFGKTVVYPFDLSRKRLQLQGFHKGRVGFGKNFSCWGLMNCFQLTYRDEGTTGLYKGLTPTVVKAAVTTALHFTVYEETCKFLAKRKD